MNEFIVTSFTDSPKKEFSLFALRTLIVAWLSISCQALSNFHSCFWLRKRCSARAMVSLAALWTPYARWNWTAASWHASWAVYRLINYMKIYSKLIFYFLVNNSRKYVKYFLLCIPLRHHSRAGICLYSFPTSWLKFSAVVLSGSITFEIQHLLPVDTSVMFEI